MARAENDFTTLRKRENEFLIEIRVVGELTNAVITADSGCNPNQMRDRVVSPFLSREHYLSAKYQHTRSTSIFFAASQRSTNREIFFHPKTPTI